MVKMLAAKSNPLSPKSDVDIMTTAPSCPVKYRTECNIIDGTGNWELVVLFVLGKLVVRISLKTKGKDTELIAVHL
jgi:hypothetical protein